MAQPPAYNRVKDFGTDYGDQTDNQAINNELDGASKSINAIRENLAKIQRDDGGLANGIVTEDSLDPALKDALYDEFSGNVNDAVLEAKQAAAEANTAAIAAEDARDQTLQIAESFGDLDGARTQWEAAVSQSQAGAASAEADAASASADADRAESAASAAAVAGRMYDTPADGVAAVGGVPVGQYFTVPSDHYQGFVDLYKNDGGVPQYVETYPNLEAALAAIAAATLAYRPIPIQRKLLPPPSAGSNTWPFGYAVGQVVLAGIDKLARWRGQLVPDDFYRRALLRPAQSLKRVVLQFATPQGAVLGGWDGLGRLRAPMVADDTMKRVLLRSPTDPGGRLDFADKAGNVYVRYPNEDGEAGGSLTGLYASIDAATKTTTFIWPHGASKMLRVVLRPNGHNDLYNVRSVSIADLGAPETAVWSTLLDTDTDWFPPMAFKALNNGDGSTTVIYTGGNHGGDGNDGGAQTARMASWAVSVDGRPLNATESFTGYVDRVTVSWKNELMAYNTISLNRYTLRQNFTIHVRPGDIDTYATVTSMPGEDNEIITDNALQMSATGYNQTCHFLGGILQARTTYSAALGTNSGPSSTWPAWAISFGHATNGFLTSWMDRSFGAGDGSLLSPSAAFMRVQAKGYHAVVSSAPYVLSAGNSYQWHGGYSWAPPDIVLGLDCAFLHRRANKPYLAWAFTAAGAGVIDLPSEYVGSIVGTASVGSAGLAVSAAGYDVESQPIQ